MFHPADVQRAVYERRAYLTEDGSVIFNPTAAQWQSQPAFITGAGSSAQAVLQDLTSVIPDPQKGAAVANASDFYTQEIPGVPPYGSDIPGAGSSFDFSPSPRAVPALGFGAITLALPFLRGLPAMSGQAVQWFQRMGTRSPIPWSSLPPWLQGGLKLAGITEFFDVITPWVDLASPSDIVDIFRNGNGQGAVMIEQFQPNARGNLKKTAIPPNSAFLDGSMVTAVWFANFILNAKLSDGRMAVRAEDGVWKFWRPRKPIVIFPGRVPNNTTLLRASKVIRKQMSAIEKEARKWKPSQRRESKPKEVIIVNKQYDYGH